jgi:glycosyltransferase involved in cell wall biosynthesis
MKIAIMGTRGIPARYGGFETCAEELAVRLVKRKYEVSVYCRSHFFGQMPNKYLGVELIFLPAIKIKFLETLSHTLFSIFHSLNKRFDVYLVFNYGNSPLLLFLLLAGKKVILHTDGLEWKRSKWSWLGRLYYLFAEWLGAKLPVPLISDSREIERYYFRKYKRITHWIPYGATPSQSENPELLQRFGLMPRDYFLQVTRFEPENNPLLTVQAFEGLKINKKLVLVGGVTYRSSYSERIKQTRDQRVILPGFIYEKRILRELLTNCYSYIHGNEVGGTNPALLEAMAAGCFIIARDVPFNREVLQDAGIYFQKNVQDLREKMVWALDNPDEIRRRGQRAQDIIREKYTWDQIINKYELLFEAVASGLIKK